jgi:hypothetical protein
VAPSRRERREASWTVTTLPSSSRSAGGSRGGTRPRCSRSHMHRLFSAQCSPPSLAWWAHSVSPSRISSPHAAQRLIALQPEAILYLANSSEVSWTVTTPSVTAAPGGP